MRMKVTVSCKYSLDGLAPFCVAEVLMTTDCQVIGPQRTHINAATWAGVRNQVDAYVDQRMTSLQDSFAKWAEVNVKKPDDDVVEVIIIA